MTEEPPRGIRHDAIGVHALTGWIGSDGEVTDAAS